VSRQYYKNYVPSSENFLVGNIAAEHAWITDNYGNYCGYLGSPYINNCNFDAAKSLLSHLYNSSALKPKGSFKSSNLKQFKQEYYTPAGASPSSLSLGDIGFVYVPSSCQSGATCNLHVAFHGCEQDYVTIGQAFVVHSGLNEWAETNNIIVIYPQAAKSSLFPFNPEGCWDWWGYTTSSYYTQQGPQMETVKSMMDAISKNVTRSM